MQNNVSPFPANIPDLSGLVPQIPNLSPMAKRIKMLRLMIPAVVQLFSSLDGDSRVRISGLPTSYTVLGWQPTDNPAEIGIFLESPEFELVDPERIPIFVLTATMILDATQPIPGTTVIDNPPAAPPRAERRRRERESAKRTGPYENGRRPNINSMPAANPPA